MEKNIFLNHKVMVLLLVKVRFGMFDFKIDNDLKMVDTTIREYYELGSENNEGK